MSDPWEGLTAETPMQAAALRAWKAGDYMLWARPDSNWDVRLVEATAAEIAAAERQGFVAPDPVTFARAAHVRGQA